MGTRRRSQPRELPRKLREIRSWLEMSQEVMATRLQKVEKGVQPGMVSRYEHGKLEPTLIVLLEYSKLGKLPLEKLVDDKLNLWMESETGSKTSLNPKNKKSNESVNSERSRAGKGQSPRAKAKLPRL